MIKQWDGIDYAGGQVNDTLTVSENIADSGGLTAALQALKQEDAIDREPSLVTGREFGARNRVSSIKSCC